jgi:hypothetical protein
MDTDVKPIDLASMLYFHLLFSAYTDHQFTDMRKLASQDKSLTFVNAELYVVPELVKYRDNMCLLNCN